MNRSIPLVLAVALFMEQMDSTVIATSLPAIAADIGTNPIALKLALTAYLVSLAIFIPISGWMADRFGAKRIFCLAIGVFMVGSLGCAMAGSLAEFVGARVVQGVGGSMMTPVARLILVRAARKDELVSAMALLTIPALVGPMVGPPVGGFITTFFSWHWIFLINVPIGIIGIWLASRILPKMPGGGAAPVDLVGFILSGFAAAGIVFGLSVISLPALPPVVGVATTLAGLGATFLYMRHARRRADPILDLRLFRVRAFRAAIAGGSLFRIGAGAVPFLLPLYFQLALGMTPFESGLLTFASAGGALAMKFLASRLLRTCGFRTVLMISGIGGAALIAANALIGASTPAAAIIGLLLAAGFLRSLFFTSANALVFAEIADGQASQATALSAVSQQVSIALGVAVAGAILEAYARFSVDGLGADAFGAAFVIVAALTALAALPFIALPPDAGSAVSGHRRTTEGTATAP
jgi:EmrB/QacA subfamily drug resistance transporter